jgi:group II intron reverse transcriptase/maturase
MQPLAGKKARTLDLQTVSTRLQRIAKLAREAPDMVLNTLAHHIDVSWLREAYERTRKDGAVGVDGQTASAYAERLEHNLRSLLERAKSGSYFAPPVRRVHVPKGNGKETRPLGIPTFEDKILQRAVAMALEAVYEQDFLDCSHGFRPKRSAHGALDALWHALMRMGGGWVLEVDLRKFFDTLGHEHLRTILHQRVRDGVLLRLIGKWLNAGVLEAGQLSRPDAGTPQGGVISPLLANVYLHEVLDKWFVAEVQPRLRGRAELIRYADDFVIVFAREDDARRVLEVLPKRFEKYGLAIHPTKTRLLDYRRPAVDRDDGPGNFAFLGFTHFWSRSKQGAWIVKRQTAKDRYRRGLKAVRTWCLKMRHTALAWQHSKLVQKLRGHCAYYGLTGNARALGRFRTMLVRIWGWALSRRSQRTARRGTWFDGIMRRYPIPYPTVVHSVYRAAKA